MSIPSSSTSSARKIDVYKRQAVLRAETRIDAHAHARLFKDFALGGLALSFAGLDVALGEGCMPPVLVADEQNVPGAAELAEDHGATGFFMSHGYAQPL